MFDIFDNNHNGMDQGVQAIHEEFQRRLDQSAPEGSQFRAFGRSESDLVCLSKLAIEITSAMQAAAEGRNADHPAYRIATMESSKVAGHMLWGISACVGMFVAHVQAADPRLFHVHPLDMVGAALYLAVAMGGWGKYSQEEAGQMAVEALELIASDKETIKKGMVYMRVASMAMGKSPQTFGGTDDGQ